MRGAPQGDLFSPKEFNVNVDCVVPHWLMLAIDDNGNVLEAGLGPTVADKLALFYADDGVVSSTESQWIQRTIDVLLGLFQRIGLKCNVQKTHMMVCYPTLRHNEISGTAYKRRLTGEGDTYRQRKGQKVVCPECGKEYDQSYLQQH